MTNTCTINIDLFGLAVRINCGNARVHAYFSKKFKYLLKSIKNPDITVNINLYQNQKELDEKKCTYRGNNVYLNKDSFHVKLNRELIVQGTISQLNVCFSPSISINLGRMLKNFSITKNISDPL